MSLPPIYGNQYFRQIGSLIEVSLDNINWFPVTGWPISVIHPDPLSQKYIQNIFTTDITLTQDNQYFICEDEYIQFGQISLNPDGTRPTIKIENVPNYPGLIKNGDNATVSGKNNITVVNINIISIGSTTLAINGGWIGQSYYSKAALNNWIINCSSNGALNQSSGGIIGSNAAVNGGNLSIIGCTSSGDQTISQGGGIISNAAAFNGGTVTIKDCSSSGLIRSQGGGIVGQGCHTVTVINCYSTGDISTGGGGIFGSGAGSNNVSPKAPATAINCYSTGNILGGGGIFGGLRQIGGDYAIAINCYSTGVISIGGGGIFGQYYNLNNTSATNCYTSGIISGSNSSGIFAGPTNDDNPPGYGTNNYSEAANGNSGIWNFTNASSTLTGSPSITNPSGTTWIYTDLSLPFNLRNIGFSPYSINNIIGSYLFNNSSNQEIIQGESSISSILPAGYTYSIISINNANKSEYPSIIMNTTTGQISTTSDTVLGTYTIILRNSINPYAITELILSVLAPPIPPIPPTPTPTALLVPTLTTPPCCQVNVPVMNTQTSNYSTHVIETRRAGRILGSNYENLMNGVGNGGRTAFSKPIFNSYQGYYMWLQGKYR